MLRTRFAIVALCAGLCTVLAACGPESGIPGLRRAPADERAAATREPAAVGEDLFARYCASCHGVDARGRGPVAELLTVPPADLTRVAELRGGVFDEDEIRTYIDGRRDVVAHGPRMMPVWGRRFDDRNAAMSDEALHLEPGMIAAIVEYLRTLQVPAQGEPR